MKKSLLSLGLLALMGAGCASQPAAPAPSYQAPQNVATPPTAEQTPPPATAPTMPSPAMTPSASVMYYCLAGKTISATYSSGPAAPAPAPGQPPTPTGIANLTFTDGSTMSLNQTISADGARYANSDGSFVFWNKGNAALVLQNNQPKDYLNCITAAPAPADGSLPVVYVSASEDFSIRLPSLVTAKSGANGYVADETYTYQEFGPGKDIKGVKFTIPASVAQGTNLSSDSYLSVEQMPMGRSCTASLFLDDPRATSQDVMDNGLMYSVASSTGAGAGNRYEETVYATPGMTTCTAVRYFVHYGVIDNYPPGSVKQFDAQALHGQFDQIRRTLVTAE